MNKNRFILGAVVFGLAILLIGCSAARPLHRTSASIRASLLKRTPKGTLYKDVITFLAEQRWQANSYSGPADQGWLERPGNAGDIPREQVQLKLFVYLGSYWVPPISERKVLGMWLFNTQNELIDVWVCKPYTDL